MTKPGQNVADVEDLANSAHLQIAHAKDFVMDVMQAKRSVQIAMEEIGGVEISSYLDSVSPICYNVGIERSA